MAADLNKLLSQVKAPTLVDAIGRKHEHRAHILDLVSPTPGRILFGPAVTMAFLPVRADLLDEAKHNFARLFYQAVGDKPAGKVLVISSNGHPNASLGGGTKFSRLANHALAGLLCDGRVRDFDELAGFGFAVYCKGETTRWGGDVVMPFTTNVPVVIDGATVVPGDYIYADSAGAVVIPAQDIDEVLKEAVRIERDDAAFIDQIREEDPAEILRKGSEER